MKKLPAKIVACFLFTVPIFSFSATAPILANQGSKPDLSPTAATLQKPEQEKKEESPISGQFTITSNYIFRGISQSNNLPAFQGGLTYTFFWPGIYFNLWGSNVYLPASNGDTATVEIDTIGGIKNTIGENFSYDISMARYNYPKSPLSYNELLMNFAYSIFFAKLGYSTNVYALHKVGKYISGGIDIDLPQRLTYFSNVNFTASMGHYELPREVAASYNDFLLQVTKQFNDTYSLAIAWTGTNGRSNTGTLGHDHLVASAIIDV